MFMILYEIGGFNLGLPLIFLIIFKSPLTLQLGEKVTTSIHYNLTDSLCETRVTQLGAGTVCV